MVRGKEKVLSIIPVMCLLGLLCMLASPTGVQAISYTDTRFGNAIEYSLDYSLTGGSTYNATFSIDYTAGGSPDAWADWFVFHLVPGVDVDITLNSTPSGTWEPWDAGNNEILWKGNITPTYEWSRPAKWSGFYLSVLDDDVVGDEVGGYTSGVQVSGAGAGVAAFDFDFILPGGTENLPKEFVEFQVGYYKGPNGSGNIVTDRLSETMVPEPATMLLLGSGLAGLAAVRRKFRKK